MNIWMNKKNAEIVLATEQWEPLQIQYDEKFYGELLPELKEFTKGRKLVKGHLVQVGWMIQNQHNVWFCLSLSAKDQFEDLGEA